MASKKDYLAIASIVKGLTHEHDNIIAGGHGSIDKDDLVKELSDYFVNDNPNFDRDKFFKVCY